MTEDECAYLIEQLPKIVADPFAFERHLAGNGRYRVLLKPFIEAEIRSRLEEKRVRFEDWKRNRTITSVSTEADNVLFQLWLEMSKVEENFKEMQAAHKEQSKALRVVMRKCGVEQSEIDESDDNGIPF